MQRTLLIGNGVNRLSSPNSGWYDLIRKLRNRAFQHQANEAIAALQPLPLVFQACCSAGNETAEKRWFAEQIETNLHGIDLSWHRRLMQLPCSDVLTTNYDFNLEHSLEKTAQGQPSELSFSSKNSARETSYSLFRRNQALANQGKAINIWHIRGDIDTDISLMLGTSQYAGGLQKLRNFLTQGVNTRNTKAADGLYRSHFAPHYWHGKNTEQQQQEPASWVNSFLANQLHAIGFSFDFAEHDLWWLIAEKQQLRDQKILPTRTTYKDTYWDIDTEPQANSISLARYELLQAFGWKIERIIKPSYAEGYEELIQRLTEK